MHVGLFALDSALFAKPSEVNVMNMTRQQVETKRVLLLSHGVCNGVLAAALVWSVSSSGTSYRLFVLAAVVVSGLAGGFWFSKRLLFLQVLPAAFVIALKLFTLAMYAVRLTRDSRECAYSQMTGTNVDAVMLPSAVSRGNPGSGQQRSPLRSNGSRECTQK
jgi:putative membrane protein